MARKIERNLMTWMYNTAKEHNLSLDVVQPLYFSFLDHVFPEVERSTPEERKMAYDRIAEYIESLDDDAEITVDQGIKIGQLKDCRSDKIWTRGTYLKMGNLLSTGRTSERFIKAKQITDGTKIAVEETETKGNA